MLLHEGLTNIHLQKRPRLDFGESFTLNAMVVTLGSLFKTSVLTHAFNVNFVYFAHNLLKTSLYFVLLQLQSI